MLPIFSTLRMVNLSDMIIEINITKTTIFTIIITITTIAVSHREESVIFVAKKIVALINI